MALPLKDFRVQLPEFVDAILDAEAIGMHEDKQTIARMVLEEWARKRHRAHKVYAKRLRANGLQMELDGIDLEEAGGRSK
jgi:hypothetical protein